MLVCQCRTNNDPNRSLPLACTETLQLSKQLYASTKMETGLGDGQWVANRIAALNLEHTKAYDVAQLDRPLVYVH